MPAGRPVLRRRVVLTGAIGWGRRTTHVVYANCGGRYPYSISTDKPLAPQQQAFLEVRIPTSARPALPF